MSGATTWKALIAALVAQQPRFFELRDIDRHAAELRAMYPKNRHVEPKIRQSLQILRDQGVLRFHGAGRYERLDVQPAFSPLLEPQRIGDLASRSQIARVVVETWAEMNLYCLTCALDGLRRLPPNTPVVDFDCVGCGARYQVKSSNRRFAETIGGAAYEPSVAAARAGIFPELVLVEYDLVRGSVVVVDAVRGREIDEGRIVRRRPLRPGARREGWVGCTIRVGGLERMTIVAPALADPEEVRSAWKP